jgi:hypothetical protein
MIFKISFKIGGRVTINLSKTSSIEVLPVTLSIYDQQGQVEELVSYLYPLPESLKDNFEDWQKYIGGRGTRRLVSPPKIVNRKDLTNSLKTELNKWLGRDGWIDEKGQSDPRVSMVLEKFREKITDKNEVQIIVQTEDRQLRGLPWQEWDTLASYTSKGVEVAISATNFKRLTQKQTPQIKATVRILVVFGDKNLNFDKEKKTIENLMERYGGEPDILEEPTRKQLEDKLKEPQGYHIFFFAGHSESDKDGTIGWIQINTHEGKQGTIEITELRELLKGAIEKKLQLAIFNSCDGLGLANQLTQLSLPYCIVMREPVDSEVAGELLKQFLEAFVKDRPLFASMNAARQELQKKFAPGTSWLPVIVANPLAKELTWNRLFSERRLSWQWEILLGLLAIAIFVCIPLGIYSEFQGLESLRLYIQLYPHLTVYPSLFLGISLFASYKAHCMIRLKTRPFAILTLITIFIVSLGLFFELNGDRMMLLEFKSDATTTIYQPQLQQLFLKWQTSKEDIYSIPQELFDVHQAFDKSGNLTLRKSDLEPAIKRLIAYSNHRQDIKGFQGLLRIATAHDVWGQNAGAFSITRWLYALNFMTIVSCVMQIFPLISTILVAPNSIFNKNKYLMYLIMCELGIGLWLPFENYSIEYTKALLFSDHFRGTVGGLNIIVYIIIFILLPTTLASIKRSATKRYQSILILFLVVTFFGIGIPGFIFGSSLINSLFGTGSTDPFTPWLAGTIVLAIFYIVLIFLLDPHVGDD